MGSEMCIRDRWALLIKFGSKAFSIFLKLLKGLKFTKLGLAGLSFAGYASMYSWKFAILLMVAVGFHESGHVWAMKRLGIKTKGFYFLPFLGGAAIAEDNYKSYGENAFVAIMGPVWGALLAIASLVAYKVTGNSLWAAAAAWMAMLNLFNLLPVTPLDGGQLVRSIAFSIHKWAGLIFLFCSMILGTILMFKLKIGLFALLLIVAAIELITEIRDRRKIDKVNRGEAKVWILPDRLIERDPDTDVAVPKKHPATMNRNQLLLTAGSYVSLIALLAYIMLSMAHIPGADLASNFME